MRTVILLILGVHLAYGETHSLRYFYTAVSGDIDFPEFTAVGLVDEEQFMYFDSNTKKVEPKTEWIRQNEGADYWDRNTQKATGAHQTFRNNIQVAKERFNHSTGLHTLQLMYGCEWDDETGAKDAFNQYGYDGEDLINLNLKEKRYVSPVQEGFITQQNWNNNKGLIESMNNYLSIQCIEWLQKYLQYGKSSLEKTVSPQVSLLQKDSSSPVTCHATGFYPSGVTITWMKNGQDHHEDVDLGELLPNEDGTFQKTSTLRVTPDEWKNNEFSCVVEHQGETKTEDEIRTNNGDSVPIGIIIGVLAAIVQLIFFAVAGYVVYQKKKGFKPVRADDQHHHYCTSLTASDSSVENRKGLKSSNISNDDSIKSLTNPNSNLDHGYSSGPENDSHSGSDSGSVVFSDCGSDSSSADSNKALHNE
ncbi:hypothetical protein ABG768_012194 [Culter alburnus]|uniref:Ig-like domain-containing protein n=1 Tax=Culter alburnus TaxID=194366 RepID=A0AAW1Z9K7_CULAL